MEEAKHRNVQYLQKLLGNQVVEKYCEIIQKDEYTELSTEMGDLFEKVQAYIDEMEAYGENRWWESDCLEEVGYYQIHSSKLLITADRFFKALKTLFGREVRMYELAINIRRLKLEAKKAFDCYLSKKEEI